MTTALDLSQEQWSSYSLATTPTIRADQERWEHGWHLLRERFGATRVAVFGSLSSPNSFDAHSDIDLVVWGIPPAQFYQAVAAVTGISHEFEVDLVDGDTPPPYLSKTIQVLA